MTKDALGKIYWAPEAADPKLAIKQGNEWVLTVTDRVPDIVAGVVNNNWTSNILPEWLILEPKTIEEILSNIHILYKEDYSEALFSFAVSTFKQLDGYFRRWTMGQRFSIYIWAKEVFDFFEKHEKDLRMISHIYNEKYVEKFGDTFSGIYICSDFKKILQPDYFEKQKQDKIDTKNRAVLHHELKLLVWFTNELFDRIIKKPNMLDELYAKMKEDWSLTDRESERISRFLSWGWHKAYEMALFYMLCVEFRLNEVTRRVKEWKMSFDEQERIMTVDPINSVGLLYDIIKSEETNS